MQHDALCADGREVPADVVERDAGRVAARDVRRAAEQQDAALANPHVAADVHRRGYDGRARRRVARRHGIEQRARLDDEAVLNPHVARRRVADAGDDHRLVVTRGDVPARAGVRGMVIVR